MRRGAAAMIAIVLIAVLGAITAVLLNNFHHNYQQRLRQEIRAQAKMLLVDFKARTEARLQADPAAPDERIVIPPFSDRFDGTFSLTFGSNEIQVDFLDVHGKTTYSEKQELNRPSITDTTEHDHEN